MGVVGALALVANLGVAALLYRYRDGDSNMRSVWICTRNDAIGNLAVMAAAAGVFGTGTGWPDTVAASWRAWPWWRLPGHTAGAGRVLQALPDRGRPARS